MVIEGSVSGSLVRIRCRVQAAITIAEVLVSSSLTLGAEYLGRPGNN